MSDNEYIEEALYDEYSAGLIYAYINDTFDSRPEKEKDRIVIDDLYLYYRKTVIYYSDIFSTLKYLCYFTNSDFRVISNSGEFSAKWFRKAYSCYRSFNDYYSYIKD